MTTAMDDRVEAGSYYTDGADVFEVVENHPLGAVTIRNVSTEHDLTVGDNAFRRGYWLVRK